MALYWGGGGGGCKNQETLCGDPYMDLKISASILGSPLFLKTRVEAETRSYLTLDCGIYNGEVQFRILLVRDAAMPVYVSHNLTPSIPHNNPPIYPL